MGKGWSFMLGGWRPAEAGKSSWRYPGFRPNLEDGGYRGTIRMQNCMVIDMSQDGMIRRITWWQHWVAQGRPKWMLDHMPAIWTTNREES